jgi:hypothetical protein
LGGVIGNRSILALLFTGLAAFALVWVAGSLVLRLSGSSEAWGAIGYLLVLIAPAVGGVVGASSDPDRYPAIRTALPLSVGAVWLAWSWFIGATGRDHADAALAPHWSIDVLRGVLAALVCWLGCLVGGRISRTNRAARV